MKIELQVKGKEVITPDFKILKEEENVFLFLFTNKIDHKIQKEINSSISSIKFEEQALILELSSNFYYFDVSKYQVFKEKKILDIGFVFYDEFDKILDIKTKIFTHEINS